MVDADGVVGRIDVPHKFDTRFEVISQFARHLAPGVSGAENLNRKIRNPVRHRSGRVGLLGDAVIGDEGHVGEADLVGEDLMRTIGTGQDAKIVRVKKVLQLEYESNRQPGFLMSHDLLHQHTIDQFAQTLRLAIAQPRDVRNGGRTGEWVEANTCERYVPQPIHQVRKRFQHVEFCCDLRTLGALYLFHSITD